MAQIRSILRLKAKLRQELLGAGLDGYKHVDLILKCRTKIFKQPEIMEILNDWNNRDLIQRFEVRMAHSKKPVTIWRATKLLIDGRL